MDKEKSPVNGRIENTSPWKDQGYQSVDKEKVPVYGQMENTNSWLDRR